MPIAPISCHSCLEVHTVISCRMSCRPGYWVPGEITQSSIQWRQLTAEEYQGELRKSLPRSGIVELFGHFQRLSQPEKHSSGFTMVDTKILRPAYCYLEYGTASNTFTATTEKNTYYPLAKMKHATATCLLYFAWLIGADQGAANIRMFHEIRRQVVEHNKKSGNFGMILLFINLCLAHMFHRDVERQFSTLSLIPKWFNNAWISQLVGVHKQMVVTLDAILEEDLKSGFFCMEPPCAEWSSNVRVLLSLTMDDDETSRAEWLELFNGDPRVPRVQHYCHKPGQYTVYPCFMSSVSCLLSNAPRMRSKYAIFLII